MFFFSTPLTVDLGTARGLPVDRDRLVRHHWSSRTSKWLKRRLTHS